MESFLFWNGSSLRNDILEVAVRAKLKNHDDVVLSKKTVIDLGCEETVRVYYF